MRMRWCVRQEVTEVRRGGFPLVLFVETISNSEIVTPGWRSWIKTPVLNSLFPSNTCVWPPIDNDRGPIRIKSRSPLLKKAVGYSTWIPEHKSHWFASSFSERRSTVSSPSVTKTATSSYRSDQVRSAEKSPSTSEQIKTQASDHRSLADSSSVPDDIPSASRSLSRSKSRDSSIPEESIPTPSASQSSSVPEDIPSASRSLPGRKSRDSSIPEESIPTPSASRNSSVPEDIADEYGNDTFESLDTSSVPNHSTPMRAELSPQKGGSSAVSRRSSRGDGEKSEEDTSYTGEQSGYAFIMNSYNHFFFWVSYEKANSSYQCAMLYFCWVFHRVRLRQKPARSA